jgi:hypothetical protein
MSGSKKIMTEKRPNINNITVTYGDMSQSEVLGLGKVVVAQDISLMDVMLVETLGYNRYKKCVDWRAFTLVTRWSQLFNL